MAGRLGQWAVYVFSYVYGMGQFLVQAWNITTYIASLSVTKKKFSKIIDNLWSIWYTFNTRNLPF